MTACSANVVVAAMCHASVLCSAASPVDSGGLHGEVVGSYCDADPDETALTTPSLCGCELPCEQAAFAKWAGMATFCVAVFHEVDGETAIFASAGNPSHRYLRLSGWNGRLVLEVIMATSAAPSWSTLMKKE